MPPQQRHQHDGAVLHNGAAVLAGTQTMELCPAAPTCGRQARRQHSTVHLAGGARATAQQQQRRLLLQRQPNPHPGPASMGACNRQQRCLKQAHMAGRELGVLGRRKNAGPAPSHTARLRGSIGTAPSGGGTAAASAKARSFFSYLNHAVRARCQHHLQSPGVRGGGRAHFSGLTPAGACKWCGGQAVRYSRPRAINCALFCGMIGAAQVPPLTMFPRRAR